MSEKKNKSPLSEHWFWGSILKNTGTYSQIALASVFINRLRKGMRLQSDPTVIYGINKSGLLGREITRSDLNGYTDFNTYKISGLPPYPICHPGKSSIMAVLNPEDTDYLYFVADGLGGHVFAKTLRSHNKNVAKWRRLKNK